MHVHHLNNPNTNGIGKKSCRTNSLARCVFKKFHSRFVPSRSIRQDRKNQGRFQVLVCRARLKAVATNLPKRCAVSLMTRQSTARLSADLRTLCRLSVTGKGMMQVLLDQSMMSGLCLVLQYCVCRRLCTSQVLITLSYQKYPLGRGAQIIRPGRACLPVEQSWKPASFEYFQLRLWQACQWSPHASTVRISLSSALQAKPELEILLGVTKLRPPGTQQRNSALVMLLLADTGLASFTQVTAPAGPVRWCATLEDAPRMPCSPISFQGSAPCATTLVLSGVHIALIAADNSLASGLMLPWQGKLPSGHGSTRSFVAILSGDGADLPDPNSDTSVVPRLTQCHNCAWLARRLRL